MTRNAYLLAPPDWHVLDQAGQELILCRAVDAGQLCSVSLLVTVSPTGRHTVFVSHQIVAVTLELNPGLRADHWREENKMVILLLTCVASLSEDTQERGV